MRALGLAGVVLLVAAAAAAQGPSLAVVPFDDVSGNDTAATELTSEVARLAAARGWRVADQEQIAKVLEERRVRYFDSLDDDVHTKILAATGADAILSGTIYRYAEGRNPVVALSARLVRADGTSVWGNVAAMSADDTEGFFGAHRKSAVIDVGKSAAVELMAAFPASPAQSQSPRGQGKPLFHEGPQSVTVGGALVAGTPVRVCILPFQNLSTNPDAVRIATDLIAIRLAASGAYEVVEPAAMRQAARRIRVGSLPMIGSDALEKLGDAIGTSLFIRGTIFKFDDPVSRGGAGDPELDVDVSMIDAKAGRIVWEAQHLRKGSDYTGLLLLGTETTSVGLTDRVVTEMVETEVRQASHNAVPSKSARAFLKRSPERRSALERDTRQTENNK